MVYFKHVYSYPCLHFLLTIKQLLQPFVYARKAELQFSDKGGAAVIKVCHNLMLFKGAFHHREADAEAMEFYEKA